MYMPRAVSSIFFTSTTSRMAGSANCFCRKASSRARQLRSIQSFWARLPTSKWRVLSSSNRGVACAMADDNWGLLSSLAASAFQAAAKDSAVGAGFSVLAAGCAGVAAGSCRASAIIAFSDRPVGRDGAAGVDAGAGACTGAAAGVATRAAAGADAGATATAAWSAAKCAVRLHSFINANSMSRRGLPLCL